jgi:hypothetical protein
MLNNPMRRICKLKVDAVKLKNKKKQDAKQNEEKKYVKKTKTIKHEQCPLTLRPTPQVLCNECISKKDSMKQIKSQKPKEVK